MSRKYLGLDKKIIPKT